MYKVLKLYVEPVKKFISLEQIPIVWTQLEKYLESKQKFIPAIQQVFYCKIQRIFWIFYRIHEFLLSVFYTQVWV